MKDFFLPLFPLNLVAFPTEHLNLHIFEPRYQQLINECLKTGKTFGVPAFVNNKLPGYGTEMEVVELYKRYDNGRLDIKTRGIRVFRITNFQNPVPNKLYAGGSVVFEEDTSLPIGTSSELLRLVDELIVLLKTPFEYDSYLQPFSFQIAHKIGLSIEQEYKLLTINNEQDRQIFLVKHLKKSVPIMAEMERTKARILMNGHFKNLDPLNL
jgi:Lon protease-like protein